MEYWNIGVLGLKPITPPLYHSITPVPMRRAKRNEAGGPFSTACRHISDECVNEAFVVKLLNPMHIPESQWI
jgi:hypothetical protein